VQKQKDLAKMEKQAEQHGEDVRKREKKVSHELKTKGNKVSALRTLGEGHGQKQKDEKKAESGEKKERVRKEECVEKVGKHLNLFAKSNDLKHAYLSDLPMILLVYKEVFFNSDDLDSCVPSVVKVLL
jgi:muconolactone delta-isomerase